MPCGAILELGWIPVRKTVRRDEDVSEHDHVEIEVRLLPVLEPKRLGDMLREELEKRGWTREPDGALTKVFGEASARLEPGSSTIRLSSSGSRTVSAEASAQGVAKEEDKKAQQDVEDKAAAAADKKLAAAKASARRALVRENADKLLEVQSELQAEVDDVTSATTKRALVERAGQMGAIDSVNERRTTDGSLELTITVRT